MCQPGEKFSSSILSVLPDLVFLLDKNLKFIDCNARNGEDLLMDPSSFLGKSIHDCLPSELSRRLERLSILSSRKKSVQTMEYNLNIRGDNRYFEARCVECPDSNFLIIVRNITKQRRDRLELSNDISMARDLQYSTLPKLSSVADERFGLSVVYKPFGEISGDLYDFHSLGEAVYRFVVVDAVGHGIQSSFLTMAIRAEIERVKSKSNISPGKLLTYLNRSLISTFKSRDSTCSAFVLDLDFYNRKIQYSAAGHPSQLIQINNYSLETIGVRSPLIGMIQGFQFPEKSLPMPESFHIFLFTDGAFEFIDSNGDIFSEYRLADLIDLTSHKSSYSHDKSGILNEVYSLLLESSVGQSLRDDLTFLHIYSR